MCSALTVGRPFHWMNEYLEVLSHRPLLCTLSLAGKLHQSLRSEIQPKRSEKNYLLYLKEKKIVD
jgi:hypothetical protein